jgi:hypothetical protein
MQYPRLLDFTLLQKYPARDRNSRASAVNWISWIRIRKHSGLGWPMQKEKPMMQVSSVAAR